MARDVSPEEISRIIDENRLIKLLLAGLLIGAASGAAAGLLFAPKKGSETRKFLKEKARDAAEMIKFEAEDIKEMALEAVDIVRAKAEEARKRGEEELKPLRTDSIPNEK
jgi:gas vesicle protein